MLRTFLAGITLWTIACGASFAQDPSENPPPPTHANVAYGPYNRNVLDLWLAESQTPTPILVSIHGGGFLGGKPAVAADLLRECLSSGISVAAITYRFSSDAIAPASFHDAARAVQFLRSHSKQWRLDPRRVAASGESAGAGLSLWLGLHDDLADPQAADPVLRESSRLTCVIASAAQTSYDPRFIRRLIPEAETYRHPALARLFDINLDDLDNLPDEKYRLMAEVSPLNHLTPDDVPVLFLYKGRLDQPVTDLRIGIHHARFGAALKPQMDQLKIRCVVQAGGEVLGGGQPVSSIEFLKQEFGRRP